jgi:hypothetical protein
MKPEKRSTMLGIRLTSTKISCTEQESEEQWANLLIQNSWVRNRLIPDSPSSSFQIGGDSPINNDDEEVIHGDFCD